MDYLENLSVIPSGFDGSRHIPKRNGKKFDEQLRYSKKEGGATLYPPSLFEG